jgi:NAD(P)-dependent dehydrogenase (short-subunit alcohol dehydrogenase family)
VSDYLAGKVAIVTGSSDGIGRAIARRFAQEGAKVVVNNRGPGGAHRPATETAREIEALGGEAVAVFGDVAEMATGERLVGAALERFGRLDILVNNAGTVRDAFIWEMTEADWHHVVDASLKGTFVGCRAAAPVLKAQGSGCILNISSLAGAEGRPRGANYVAAKAGIIGLTRALDTELWAHGVRVSCVAPMATSSMIGTSPMPPGYPYPHYRTLSRPSRPPEAVAAVLTFLASDLGREVHGEVLWVQAGSIGAYDEPRFARVLHGTREVWDVEELAAAWTWAMKKGD